MFQDFEKHVDSHTMPSKPVDVKSILHSFPKTGEFIPCFTGHLLFLFTRHPPLRRSSLSSHLAVVIVDSTRPRLTRSKLIFSCNSAQNKNHKNWAYRSCNSHQKKSHHKCKIGKQPQMDYVTNRCGFDANKHPSWHCFPFQVDRNHFAHLLLRCEVVVCVLFGLCQHFWAADVHETAPAKCTN